MKYEIYGSYNKRSVYAETRYRIDAAIKLARKIKLDHPDWSVLLCQDFGPMPCDCYIIDYD